VQPVEQRHTQESAGQQLGAAWCAARRCRPDDGKDRGRQAHRDQVEGQSELEIEFGPVAGLRQRQPKQGKTGHTQQHQHTQGGARFGTVRGVNGQHAFNIPQQCSIF
jgi:hypothetical protein